MGDSPPESSQKPRSRSPKIGHFGLLRPIAAYGGAIASSAGGILGSQPPLPGGGGGKSPGPAGGRPGAPPGSPWKRSISADPLRLVSHRAELGSYSLALKASLSFGDSLSIDSTERRRSSIDDARSASLGA